LAVEVIVGVDVQATVPGQSIVCEPAAFCLTIKM